MNRNALSIFLTCGLAYGLACPGLAPAAASAPVGSATSAVVQTESAQAPAQPFAPAAALAVNPGVLDLLNRVQELQAEVARMRGVLDELSNQLRIQEKRQRDLFGDLDQRIKTLDGRLAEATRPAAPKETVQLQSAMALNGERRPAPPAAKATPQEIAAIYEQAYTLFKKGNYEPAVKGFQDYLDRFPEAEFAPNALYWQGLGFFALKDYKQAIAAQQLLLKRFPKHDKAPDAMLSLARAQHQARDRAGALATLDHLIKQYPDSRAASTGRKLRVTL